MGSPFDSRPEEALILAHGPRRALVEGVLKVAIALCLLVGIGLSLDRLGFLPPLRSGAFVTAGIVLVALGIAFEAYSTSLLWNLGEGTPNPAAPPHRLVTQRIYAATRNPLYLARLTLLSGAAVALGSTGIALVTLSLFLGLEFVLLPREEARLLARYGESYRTYRRRTPRWLSLHIRRTGGPDTSSDPSARAPER